MDLVEEKSSVTESKIKILLFYGLCPWLAGQPESP